jgi:hypothetical protein
MEPIVLALSLLLLPHLSLPEHGIKRRLDFSPEAGQLRIQDKKNDKQAEHNKNAGHSPIHVQSSAENRDGFYSRIMIQAYYRVCGKKRKEGNGGSLSSRFPGRWF